MRLSSALREAEDRLAEVSAAWARERSRIPNLEHDADQVEPLNPTPYTLNPEP